MFAIKVEPDNTKGPILIVDLDTDEVYYVTFARFEGTVEMKSIPSFKPPPQFKESRIWLEVERWYC